MKNLKISANKIKELIDLKFDDWQYPSSTNCYAYALGLDVPYNKLTNHAYKVGCFSEDALKRKKIDAFSIDFEKALHYDLHYLGLSYVEVDPNYVIKNDDINYNYFLIAFYKGIDDFHFLRKNNFDNTWYHKPGYLNFPKNKDDDKKIIYNPEDAFFYHYDYVKTYKIGYKVKR